jgi:hypothetical protein
MKLIPLYVLAILGVGHVLAPVPAAQTPEHAGNDARVAAIEAADATVNQLSVSRKLTDSELSAPTPQPTLVLPEGPLVAGRMYDFKVDGLPDGVNFKLSYRINGGLATEENLRVFGDGRTGVIAFPVGQYEISVFGAGGRALPDGQVDITLVDDRGIADVRGAPPGPAPPNPGPGPGPVPPQPGTLGALVPDPAHRALVAEFFVDVAGEVRKGAFASTTHFRTAYREAWKQFQDTGRLPLGLAAIDQPISDRIVAAIGLAESPIDDAKKTALAAALDAIAGEFK